MKDGGKSFSLAASIRNLEGVQGARSLKSFWRAFRRGVPFAWYGTYSTARSRTEAWAVGGCRGPLKDGGAG